MATPQSPEGQRLQRILELYKLWLGGEIASEEALFSLGDLLALREGELLADAVAQAMRS